VGVDRGRGYEFGGRADVGNGQAVRSERASSGTRIVSTPRHAAPLPMSPGCSSSWSKRSSQYMILAAHD
jgi:hypothetical protein